MTGFIRNIGLLFCLFSGFLSFGQDTIRVENLGSEVNTNYSETAPVISPDGKTLYFIRFHHPQNTNGEKGKEGDGSAGIWYSEWNAAQKKWSVARKMVTPLNREDYNHLYSITPDGNTILIKGQYNNGRYETRGFSISTRRGLSWSAPQKLNMEGYEKISKGKFDSGFMSNDGKVILMAFSEKKNSFKDDLYVSFKQKDESWSKPVSLGKDINTDEFTESTPFLASDGATLYFSSDRKGGYGSNDIYVSKRLDRSWKKWSKPVNLGPKVNTEEYDGYYSIAAAGDYAYFSSSAKGTLGKADIVRIAIPKPKEPAVDTSKATEVVAAAKVPEPDPVVMLKGKAINSVTGKPIGAVIRYETLPEGEEVGTANSDPSTGEYSIVLPFGKNYSMRAEAPGFIPEAVNIDLTDTTELGKNKTYKEITHGGTLKLVPIEEGRIVRLNNIFFETAKSELRGQSTPELDRMVLTLKQNPTMRIELGGHTDNRGDELPNLKLSQERADAVKAYIVSKGIANDRVVSKGYGESRPVATNLTDAGRQENRRVEFLILKK